MDIVRTIIFWIARICTIAGFVFILFLSNLSLGSWQWLLYVFAALIFLSFIGRGLNKLVNRGFDQLRERVRGPQDTGLTIVQALMAQGVPQEDALKLVREYAATEARRRN